MSKITLIICLSLALLTSASDIFQPADDVLDFNTALDQYAVGIDVLMSYFDQNFGLWQDPDCMPNGGCIGGFPGWGWANALQVLADYQKVRGDRNDYSWAYDSIYNHNFIGDYFDDQGWWGLAMMQLYFDTNDWRYVDKAVEIVNDMKNRGGTDICGANSIFWSDAQKYIASIANELFISLNAKIRMADGRATSNMDDARNTFDWLQNSGLIGGDNIIMDGLNVNDDGSCGGINNWEFTYNNGVILSGLVDIALRAGESGFDGGYYMSRANDIARAAIAKFNQDGWVADGNIYDKTQGGDGVYFKGIFVKNLAYLAMNTNDQDLKQNIVDFLNFNYNGLINNQGTGQLYAYAWNRGRDDNNGYDVSTHITSLYLLDAIVMLNQ